MEHKYVDIQEVRNNPNRVWNKSWLSRNKQLTVKDIETLDLPNSTYDWDWNDISEHIDINEVRNNPAKPWNREWPRNNEGCTNKILQFFDTGLLKHLQRKIYKFTYHTDITLKYE